LGAGAVLPGWDQGLVGMKVGGKRSLAIPSSAERSLLFEVELTNVEERPRLRAPHSTTCEMATATGQHIAITSEYTSMAEHLSSIDIDLTPRQRVFAIVGASSGNLVEWFDFYIYSFCALYFSSAFFPSGNPTTQLLNTAGIFAAGFLMRPVGGWLFGRIADRYGRKNAMMISVLMMCGGSLMIAVLPTYAQIGTAAPALLLLARLFQGLSVGGEYGTSATYMSEVALPGRRGFFASFQYVTLIGGQLLALLVLVILQLMLTERRTEGLGLAHSLRGAAPRRPGLALPAPLAAETTKASDRKSKEAGSLASPAEAQARLHHGARLHGRRLADLLHVYDLYAEIPGQHGRHEHQDRQRVMTVALLSTWRCSRCSARCRTASAGAPR
jgi:hypothetical protein